MVTSQIPLGLVLEQRMPLDPLPIPKNNMAHDNPAIQLFVERARRVRPAPAAGALQRVRHAGRRGFRVARGGRGDGVDEGVLLNPEDPPPFLQRVPRLVVNEWRCASTLALAKENRETTGRFVCVSES